jgi:hypothetical protein
MKKPYQQPSSSSLWLEIATRRSFRDRCSANGVLRTLSLRTFREGADERVVSVRDDGRDSCARSIDRSFGVLTTPPPSSARKRARARARERRSARAAGTHRMTSYDTTTSIAESAHESGERTTTRTIGGRLAPNASAPSQPISYLTERDDVIPFARWRHPKKDIHFAPCVVNTLPADLISDGER